MGGAIFVNPGGGALDPGQHVDGKHRRMEAMGAVNFMSRLQPVSRVAAVAA